MRNQDGGAPPEQKISLSLERKLTMAELPSVNPTALIHVINATTHTNTTGKSARTRKICLCL